MAQRHGQDGDSEARARRFAWTLLGLGLLTRLLWSMWLHPPASFVFSDMSGYVSRATRLADGLVEPGQRELAWQAYGTHFVLALPLWVFGKSIGMVVAGALWGVLGAICVPLTYLLAHRVFEAPACRSLLGPWRDGAARATGIVMLLWIPLWMGSGWFLSEVPFCAFQLLAMWGTVEMLASEERPGALPALGIGVAWALSLAVRPQAALMVLLALGTIILARRGHRVGARAIVLAAIPLVLVAGFSSWRFHRHTGRWIGVSENASMNLTAGRCHNIVTLGEPTPGTAARMVERYGEVKSRRVSLPSFRVLAKLPPWHPLHLAPALGDTVRVDGYIGDPDLHREVRSRCYRATGVVGQVRYTITNASLLWFFSRQWPVSADAKSPRAYFVASEVYRYIFGIVFWFPSWVGTVWVIRRLREHPGAALLAWQLVASVVVAAVFFGTIRLRTPYDPYAIILAVIGAAVIARWVARRRQPPSAEG